MNKQIDTKHSIGVHENGDPYLFKHTNNQEIDLNVEPVILFRGRDRLALPMLKFYRQLCIDDGATEFQINSMDEMISKFEKFSQESRTMKQPGSTLGK